MKTSNPNPDNTPKQSTNHGAAQAECVPSGLPRPPRSTGKSGRDPIDYATHPYPSMQRFAGHLVLSHDTARTRHSYYRQMRLIHEHFGCDPESLGEEEIRDYILHVKVRKGWRPKTIRQAAAAARLFYEGMLGREDWKVFGQIRTKDHDELPVVLTRGQVVRLLEHVRLRRYRIPLKLIYCCGLRLSECLNLTVHDILGAEGKLVVRGGKGGKDRMVPLAPTMLDDLHLTHRSEQDCRKLVETLCAGLPR